MLHPASVGSLPCAGGLSQPKEKRNKRARGGKLLLGRSHWKKWTPEAILKAGEHDACASLKAGLPKGSSHASAMYCQRIYANCIDEGQNKGLESMRAQSRESPLKWFITNNMFDETKLLIGSPSTRRVSCLAWHSQVSWSRKLASGLVEVKDEDVIRSPRTLKSYTAATLWNLCAAADDTGGLYPRGDAMLDAEYVGSLASTDSHSVNLLLFKHLVSALPPNHFLLAALCTQHRTGSVVEEISKKWGLLPCSFCLAARLENADFHDDLRDAVQAVLNRYLNVVSGLEDPAGEADICMARFAEELTYECHAATCSDNQDRDAAEERAQEGIRKEEAAKLLAFFPPPWIGPMNHPCPPGCCGERECHDRDVSIRRGTDLIMKVIFPRMSRPAANRYTKIFPVVLRICLMMHFYAVMHKALQILLRGRRGDSDDDAVLRHDNAVIGAPDDVIAHQRKLQATWHGIYTCMLRRPSAVCSP